MDVREAFQQPPYFVRIKIRGLVELHFHRLDPAFVAMKRGSVRYADSKQGMLRRAKVG